MREGLFLYGSVTRISDLSERDFTFSELPGSEWATGDYVVGRVLPYESSAAVELPTGRVTKPVTGDFVIGALGERAGTFESTGRWQDIEHVGLMHALTGAGLIGRCTSRSPGEPARIPLSYAGHVRRAGAKVTMSDFVERVPQKALSTPVILVVGSSMSSGKTTIAKTIIRDVGAEGLRVAGAKMSGAASLNDISAMRDAGAVAVFDCVDMALPSTIVDEDTYFGAATNLLARIENEQADVVVVEIGASPLEPYNGKIAMDLIRPNVVATILCTMDPYGITGAIESFGVQPDFIGGWVAGNSAGRDLVRRLTGLEAIDPREEDLRRRLKSRLLAALEVGEAA